MPSSPSPYISQLKNRGVIQLVGEERVKYLQGQVTTDIAKLTPSTMQLSCHCDFKGKMWSLCYTFDWQSSILLLPHQSVLASSLAELNKYGVFAKVDITDQSDNWIITGGTGTEFETAIKQVFTRLPENDGEVVSNDNGLVVLFNAPIPRYLVLQPKTAELTLDITGNGESDDWEAADIQAGLGDIRQSSSGEFVPQMLNLQYLNAIDFEKGCYMGQEVIARTKYLGRNKKAGFILTCDAQLDSLEGETLEFAVGDNWRPGGKILRSAVSHGQTWAFAVLANDTEQGAQFRLKSSPEVTLTTQALPYELQ